MAVYQQVRPQINEPFIPYEQYQLFQQQMQGNYDLTRADTEWFMQPLDLQDETSTTLIDPDQLQIMRHADTALTSWGFEKSHFKRLSSRLSLSGRGSGSEIDVKSFLAKKGKTELDGLHRAASKGDTNWIMNIIKREGLNAPLNSPDENGCTPLMYAALADSPSAVEMLLNFGVKREQTDAIGRTAVHYAAFFGKNKALKFLIESGSDWTPRDSYGRTPLHWTSANKNTKCLLTLLDYARTVHGNINFQDNEGMTPAHCMAQYGATKHIILLDEANCNFSITDVEGKTALHWTVDNIDGSCLHAIIDRYPYLLNKQDSYGHTILHLSSYRGNVVIVDELLSITGIEINTRDKEDRTPMHLAAIEGHSRVIELLVIFRALDSCIDSYGLTALHYAVQINAVECVKVLATSGYTTHVPSADDRGITPLILAAELGFNEILKVLLKNSVIAEEINHCDPNGYSALHYTTNGGFHECVATLSKHGCDPNILDKSGLSALDIACERGHHLCIEPLITGGANIDAFDSDGYTLFQRAILNQELQIVEEFIRAQVDVEKMDANGRTPLQLAVYTGNEDILALFLRSITDPNQMDLSGLTPMHIAAIEGHAGALKLLLKNGGYSNNMDASEERYTPLDYAKQNHHSKCIKLLEENGGLTVHEIKTIAAICIQTLYRKHRAKKVVERKRLEKFAAICIQRHTRGFLQRKRFQCLQKQHEAAIKIQAVTRGFITRCDFRKKLQKYRENKQERALIKSFGHMLLEMQRTELQQITLEMPSEQGKGDSAKKETEWQKKVEECLKLRELYSKQQEEWKKFRLAEKQRRIEKKWQMEQDRLMTTIKNSQEKRRYFQNKFRYTMTVRSCHQAATIIQRAYRRAKEREEKKTKEEETKRKIEMMRQTRAAIVIQRSWKCYNEWKSFKKNHLHSIVTSPVILIPHRYPSEPEGKSYERETIISGSRRHKLHQTQKSGFKIFKPLPSSHSQTRPSTNVSKHSLLVDTVDATMLSPRMKTMVQTWPWSRCIISSSNSASYTRQSNLPSLVPPYHSNNTVTASTSLKLPQLT